MRNLIAKLIYRKWFYAFLATVLWFDTLTDVAGFFSEPTMLEGLSLVLSGIGAAMVTLVFVDLHRRWPPDRG